MFGLFRRSTKASLDSLRFNSAEYTFEGESGQSRLWVTEDGDRVSLHLFTVRPDLPKVGTVADLRGFYTQGIEASGGQLVETSLLRVGGCPAIKVVVKVPQQPFGMTYVGSLTIPFRDFSFVVKVQCQERGTTGLREAVLLDRQLAAGEVPESALGRVHVEADAEEFDVEFPQHPVSRVRRVLQQVCDSLVLDAEVAGATGFTLPKESA